MRFGAVHRTARTEVVVLDIVYIALALALFALAALLVRGCARL